MENLDGEFASSFVYSSHDGAHHDLMSDDESTNSSGTEVDQLNGDHDTMLSTLAPPSHYGHTIDSSHHLHPQHNNNNNQVTPAGSSSTSHHQQQKGSSPSLKRKGDDLTKGSAPNTDSVKKGPANGKKTKGRVKIKMEYIDNKLRRYTTFSKRKTGIMKKAYELSTLTGTQVMLLVASETGHVYTFATKKLQPMITSDAGKALIQTCLNSPDTNNGMGDQRMSATGFEETDLTYVVTDESSEERNPSEHENSPGEDVSIHGMGLGITNYGHHPLRASHSTPDNNKFFS